MDAIDIIAQGLGVLAVVLGFVSWQMKTHKQLLIMQTVTGITFVLHYLLLGATSAMVMNIIGIGRNLAYYHRDKPLFSGKKCPIFFAVVMGIAGLTAWEGYYTLLAVAGLVINTLCLSLTSTQKMRKSILVTSPMVLLYDVFVLSIGGIVYESVAIISSVIGLVRYRKELAAKE